MSNPIAVNHIYSDVFDDVVFEDARNEVDLTLTGNVSDSVKSVCDPLIKDVFNSLHQSMPVRINDDIPTLGLGIIEDVTATQEFKALRSSTVGSQINSAIATQMMIDSIGTELISLGDELDKLVENTSVDPVSSEKLIDSIRQGCRDVMTCASSRIDSITDAGDMVYESVSSPKQKVALASKLVANQKMQAIIKMAGRLRRVALAKRKERVREIQQEYVGVTIGSDVSAAIPSELALLANPATRAIFLRKMVEGQLLQYDKESKERLGQGPIVLLLDVSGSMSGEKDTWAKAVALAYIKVAKIENRDIEIITFNDNHYRYTIGKVKGGDETNSIMSIINKSPNGGTNFQDPLTLASNTIRSSGHLRNADVVMITDGEASLDDLFIADFNNLKKSHGFQMQSILIGVAGPTALDKISDKCYYVSDIINADKAIAEVWGN